MLKSLNADHEIVFQANQKVTHTYNLPSIPKKHDYAGFFRVRNRNLFGVKTNKKPNGQLSLTMEPA